MLKLTEKIIRDKLADLIGTKVGWGGYEAESRLANLLREYAQANGLNPLDFRADKAKKGWRIDLTYKKYSIGSVEIKREKAKKHYSHFGDYCDYNYKGFAVWLWVYPEKNEDVETRIAEIDQVVVSRQKAADDKKAHGREVMELLKKTYNLDNYGVRQLVDYLNANKYSLTD